MDDITPVRVEFDAKTIGDHVDVEYRVTNQSASPILLLDLMRDWHADEDEEHPIIVDPGWAYVEIFEGPFGNKAVLSRRLLEQGEWVENAEVPYGRRIGAGQTVSGKFQVRLPLMEMTSCYAASERPARREGGRDSGRVTIRSVEFQIGWSPELPPEGHEGLLGSFEFDGYLTWNFIHSSYHGMRARQRVSRAGPLPVHWEALSPPREASVNTVRSGR